MRNPEVPAVTFAERAAAMQAKPLNRPMITLSIMTATVMIALDTTIANVALPHMQGSVSASADQITWVLTSYIVAAAIFTPLTGWLTGRYGREDGVPDRHRRLHPRLGPVRHRHFACAELVLARLVQGVFGAAMLPLSQAGAARHQPARERTARPWPSGAWGAMLGPIMGPALGGWLTENLSWRWCFYINLPFGLLALAGVFLFIHGEREAKPQQARLLRLSAPLSLGIGALQMMLDRGQIQDWFSSTEIWIEATVADASASWSASSTRRPPSGPSSPRACSPTATSSPACCSASCSGSLIYATMALLPPDGPGRCCGYPVLTTGLVMAPRGIGTLRRCSSSAG